MSERNSTSVLVHSDVDVTTSAIFKNNWVATAAPNPLTDDSSAGYSVGSEWIDVVGNVAYKCADDTVGAAVWLSAGGAFLPLAGGTMTGDIVLANTVDLLLDDNSAGTGPSRVQWNSDNYIQYDDQGEGNLEIVGNNDVTIIAGLTNFGFGSGILSFNSGSATIPSIQLASTAAYNGSLTHEAITGADKIWTMPDATGIIAIKPENEVVVNSKSDFPAPSGGIITLVTGITYSLGDDIDLTGDKITFSEDSRITCNGAATNTLSSTGLAAGSYLFTALDVNCSLANIAIDCSGAKFISFTNAAAIKRCFITNLGVTNSTDLGKFDGGAFVKLFGNLFTACSGGFTAQGTLNELEVLNNNTLAWTGTPTFLTIPSTATLHSANIGYNSLHVEAAHFGFNISPDVTFAAGGLISNNFFQNGGTYLVGIDASHPDWRIPANSNVGIAGLSIDVQSPVKRAWLTTSTTFIEITDPTASGEVPAFVGSSSSYDASATQLDAEFTCEVAHDQISQDVVTEIYNTTDDLSMGFGGDAKLDVDTIAWQSGIIIRDTYNGTPDLTQVKVGDKIVKENSTNASNNGTFLITAFSDVGDWIEYDNPNRTDATDDEATDSPSTAYGGSVVWTTVAAAGVDEAVTTEAFGLDPNKSYTPRLRRGSSSGGNPNVYMQFGVLTTKIF